jgi:hypothetical protein
MAKVVEERGEVLIMRSFPVTIMLASLLFQPSATTQDSSPQRSSDEEAVAAVRQESQANFPLRAVWAPGLSDDLIFLKTQGRFSPGAEVPLVRFYRVTIAPYELRGNKIERQAVEVDNYSEWLVAIDQDGGQKYFLQGSKNPVAEFNRLMQGLRLHVGDTDTALAVFDFFLKAVQGQQARSRVVGDGMKLQSIALEDFRSRFPAARSRAAFNAWWNALPAAARRDIRPPWAQATKADFVVRYTLYDRGSLRKETLMINADGTVTKPNAETHASTMH